MKVPNPFDALSDVIGTTISFVEDNWSVVSIVIIGLICLAFLFLLKSCMMG